MTITHGYPSALAGSALAMSDTRMELLLSVQEAAAEHRKLAAYPEFAAALPICRVDGEYERAVGLGVRMADIERLTEVYGNTATATSTAAVWARRRRERE